METKGSYLGWKRNTEGIKAAAQRKREAAFIKTEAAINQLIKERKPIHFESVAEAAGVTRAWLYKQPELRTRIETLREQQTPKQQLPIEIRASESSKDTLIAELRKQNKQLRAEKQKLQKELEVAYGQALGLEDLIRNNKELERQNQHLFNLLTQTRVEIDALKERAKLDKFDIPY